MSVLNRPLFRQVGGPAQPMPQDMAPAPPPMAPPQPRMNPEMARQAGVLEQAEMQARATGEELGAEYAQKMMAGIDSAQSTEDLINALRGNDKPLDARRDELAGYVGQSDAEQTPESVLAMVQPVIMMTEEGIMDSGIGNLMQQITGEVDMMTESGQPTDMGQGVGSLMMAGAPEAPAPQNFRQGGAVQKFQTGGAAALASEASAAYKAFQPLFSELINQEERAARDAEREAFDKSQFFLSAARGGLRLAQGDPKVSGSFISQLAAAAEPTVAEMAQIAAQAQTRKDARRKEDRALDAAAMQAAISSAQTERQAEIASQAAAQAFQRKAFLDLTLEQIKQGAGGLGTGEGAREDAFLVRKAQAFADGTLSADDLARFETIVSREYITKAQTPVFVPGVGYVTPNVEVPKFLVDANNQRIGKGFSGFNFDTTASTMTEGPRTENLPDPGEVSTAYPGTEGLPEGAEVLPKSVAYEEFQRAADTKNLGDAFGTGAVLSNFFNKFFGIFEMGVPNEQVETYLNTYEVNRRKAVIAQMTALEGRQSQEFFNQEYANFPEPAAFLTPDSAAESKLRAIVAGLRQDLATAKEKLNDPVIAGDQAALKKQRQGIDDLESALGFWGRFYNDLAADVGGGLLTDESIAEIVNQVRAERGTQ